MSKNRYFSNVLSFRSQMHSERTCLVNFAKDDYTSKYFNLRAKLRCFLHYGYRHQSSFGHRRLSHFINITSGWINLLAGQRTWCSNSENSVEYALLEATCLGCFVDHEVSDQLRSSEMKSSRYLADNVKKVAKLETTQ